MASKRLAAPVVHLEGTTLEGGGQLLRIALGLSALTRKPINVTNIRGKRSGGGGLKPQHLTCVQWLGQACKARLSGMGLKAKEITFTPDPHEVTYPALHTGEVRIMQNTPGSVNLVLQAILPYVVFSGVQNPIRIRITGGTNVSNSPSIDYVSQVLIPMLKLIGIPQMQASLNIRGWSQGNMSVGSITYTVTPISGRLPAFQLVTRGEIVKVQATIIAPRDTEQDFREELDLMFSKRENRFFGQSSPDIDVKFEHSYHEKRYYLLLVSASSTGIKLGRDWLYDQAIRPGKTEKIIPTMVKKVSDDLLMEIEHGGCVDEFMRDQLVVFQALAEGRSTVFAGKMNEERVKLSLHTQTAMWVAQKIIGVEFDEDGCCDGIGLLPGGASNEKEQLAAIAEDMAGLQV